MMNLLFGVCLGLVVGVYVGAWAYERLRTKPSEYAAALHEARYFTPAEAQAIRRSIGNAAILRAALIKIRSKTLMLEVSSVRPHRETAGVMREICDVALAAPARNCDLPNITERYNEFCYNHRNMETCCANCPYGEDGDCEASWLLATADGGADDEQK